MNWGNSGILFFGKYELQIIESHDSLIYADGIAGAIYGQTPPLVNVSRKPGEWQTYDIVFGSPAFQGQEAHPAGLLHRVLERRPGAISQGLAGTDEAPCRGHVRFARVNRPVGAAIPQFGRSLSQYLDPPLEIGRVDQWILKS